MAPPARQPSSTCRIPSPPTTNILTPRELPHFCGFAVHYMQMNFSSTSPTNPPTQRGLQSWAARGQPRLPPEIPIGRLALPTLGLGIFCWEHYPSDRKRNDVQGRFSRSSVTWGVGHRERHPRLAPPPAGATSQGGGRGHEGRQISLREGGAAALESSSPFSGKPQGMELSRAAVARAPTALAIAFLCAVSSSTDTCPGESPREQDLEVAASAH